MLNISQITNAACVVAKEFDIKRIVLFGSYAEGTNTPESDVDLMVEFNMPFVSLLTISSLKIKLEELLNISVDIVRLPLPENAIIIPETMVELYAA